MVFNSYIFVLLFFPLVLLTYSSILLGGGKRNVEWAKAILVISSIIFYLYNGVLSFGIFIVLCVGNFFFYSFLRVTSKKFLLMRKTVLFFGVLVNLLILIYFKYYNFLIDNFNYIFGSELQISEIIVPLGLSFITFQNIAFLIDVYQSDVVKCSILDYAFYISYFPKILSGPITMFCEFRINTKKEEFWDNMASGFYLFTMGLGKKVLLADALAKLTDAGYLVVDKLNMPTALLVILAYTFQIYFDFSGYSDMAIGISRMLQIKLADNFNSPYKAKTIDEFWDRWHISLTRFLTKYLYIPLGGNRKGKRRTYFNILIVFLCSGLWHGASWTFIIWGGVHGVAMVISRQFKHVIVKIPKLINQIITFIFINFTWIIFRSGNFHTLKAMCRAILRGGWGKLVPEVSSAFAVEWPEKIFGVYIPNIVYLMLFLFMIGVMVFDCQNAKEKADKKQFTLQNAVWVLIIFLSCLLSFSHITSYIYTRF